MCLDNYNNIILRNCTNEGWNPIQPPDCKKFLQKNSYCPQEFDEIQIKNDKYLCINVSMYNQPWLENYCYGSEKTIFDVNNHEKQIILKFLYDKYNITRFWLPAKRANITTNNNYKNDDNNVISASFNPLVWYLPGDKWGEEISENYIDNFYGDCAIVSITNKTDNRNKRNKNSSSSSGSSSSISSKNNSSRSNNKNVKNSEYNIKIEIGDCSEKLRSVCIFEKDLFIQSKCPKDYAALSYQPYICYGFNFIVEYLSQNKNEENENPFYYDELIPYIRKNYLHMIRDDNVFQVSHKIYWLSHTYKFYVQS